MYQIWNINDNYRTVVDPDTVKPMKFISFEHAMAYINTVLKDIPGFLPVRLQ